MAFTDFSNLNADDPLWSTNTGLGGLTTNGQVVGICPPLNGYMGIASAAPNPASPPALADLIYVPAADGPTPALQRPVSGEVLGTGGGGGGGSPRPEVPGLLWPRGS